MKINEKTYVDEAERVILKLKIPGRDGKARLKLSTSKIRNLLSMVSELYTDAQHTRSAELTDEQMGRIQYLKMRMAYESGREQSVREFVEAANLLTYISEIGESKKNLLLFCNYMEALVAYHKYHGGE